MGASIVHDDVQVTDADIARFQADGVVAIRSLLGQFWLDGLREACDRVLEGPGTINYAKGTQPKFNYAGFLFDKDPEVRRFLLEGPAAGVAGKLMRASRVRYFKDQLFAKEPGAATTTPWHQDLPYWCVDGDQVCSVWIALDRVDAGSGAVRYVRGSHRLPDLYQPEDFSGEGGIRNPELSPAPDIDADPSAYDVVSFDLDPGDCVVFHGRMLHGASGNASSERRRRGFSTRWLGNDVVYRPSRPGCSPARRESGLKDGEPISGDVFPLAWCLAGG